MIRARIILGLAAIAIAAAPAHADPARRPDFYVHFGGALIAPLTSSDELELADVDGPASLAVHDGPIAGSGATVERAAIPAAAVGYVLPLGARRWSIETVLGPPFTVRFRATGTLADMSIAPTALGIPTGVGPLGPELGEATALPPILTAVYQLRPDGALRPYVGAGASVLVTRDAKITNPMLTAGPPAEMTIAPAPGLVVQGGLEARLRGAIFARVDVKLIAMRARAVVHHLEVETPDLPLFERVEVGTATMHLWVNPLVVQAGVGFDF